MCFFIAPLWGAEARGIVAEPPKPMSAERTRGARARSGEGDGADSPTPRSGGSPK